MFVPEGYRGSYAVIYVHGYYTDVDQAVAQYKLAEQFAQAAVPAIYVVPEAPKGPGDPVRWPALSELLEVVRGATGLEVKTVHAIGHSGAYRTLLDWLKAPQLRAVTLLDALYAGVAAFKSWALAPGHKLYNFTVAAGDPAKNSVALRGAQGVVSGTLAGGHYDPIKPGGFLPQAIAMAAPYVVSPLLLAVGAAVLLLLSRL